MSLSLQGIGVSKGIAIGNVYIIQNEPEINESCIQSPHIPDEIERFENAISLAREQLLHIRKRVPKNTTIDIAALIDAHLLMLEDSLLSKVPIDLIYEHQCNAEWALKMQCDSLVQSFEQMADPYLSARKNDVKHVVTRIQRILGGDQDTSLEPADL
ncbi:phosphoenolpyruvate-protein phosphotransferase, partial [Candidatus Thiomargarita nelsonii]